MKEARIIILLFNGEAPNDLTRGAMKAALKKYCKVTSDIEMVALDSEEISRIIVSEKINGEPQSIEVGEIQDMYRMMPEEKAVIYIGTLMKDELTNFNAVAFTSALLSRINEASTNPSQEDNKAFMNALFILSGEDLRISRTILEKYKLDPQRIALIKHAYSFASSF